MRINRLYSRELRAARRAAEFIEGHDVFTTISLWAFGHAFFFEIVCFWPVDEYRPYYKQSEFLTI